MSKAALDRLLSKYLSRKLMTFLIACGMVYLGRIASEDWTLIACIYIGSQACVDVIEKWKA